MNTVISGYTLTPINNHKNFGEYKLSIHKFNTTKCHTTYLINDPDSTTKRIHNGHIFLLSNSIDWLTDYCLMFSKQYFSYIQDENKFNIYKLYRTGWRDGWTCVSFEAATIRPFFVRDLYKRGLQREGTMALYKHCYHPMDHGLDFCIIIWQSPSWVLPLSTTRGCTVRVSSWNHHKYPVVK